jgi:hypothetical protein
VAFFERALLLGAYIVSNWKLELWILVVRKEEETRQLVSTSRNCVRKPLHTRRTKWFLRSAGNRALFITQDPLLIVIASIAVHLFTANCPTHSDVFFMGVEAGALAEVFMICLLLA